MRRRLCNRLFSSRHAALNPFDYRRACICVCCSHLFVCMFSGINSPSHLPRRLRRHMSGGGRAWRHIGREKRAIYRLQTAPRHVSGCGGQCAAECAATGAARRRRGERVALSVVCGRGVKIASITLCRHEMILTGWGIDLPASASVSPASRFGGIYPLFVRRSISVVSFTT